jgi:hypothetical protein
MQLGIIRISACLVGRLADADKLELEWDPEPRGP